MADKKITKRWLKNHFAYSWWKYLLLCVCSAMGVNLIFTTTAYRPPEHKKIEVFVCNSYVDSTALYDDLSKPFFEALPEQEELTIQNIILTSGDMYAPMQFSTYCAAQQGDVCILPVSEVHKLAAEGADYAFLELTPYIESGAIDVGEIDLQPGVLKNSDGVEGVYAIPADSLFGLVDYGNDPADSMICIMGYCGNEDASAWMVDLMLKQFEGEKPAGYDEVREAAKKAVTYY